MLWTCHFPKGSEFLKNILLHFNCRNVQKLNKLWNWGVLCKLWNRVFLSHGTISVWNYFTCLIWIKIVFQCVSLVLLHDIVCLHHPTHCFSPLFYSLFFCTGVMSLHSWITQMSIDLLEVGTLPSYWEEIWSDCLNKRSQRESKSGIMTISLRNQKNNQSDLVVFETQNWVHIHICQYVAQGSGTRLNQPLKIKQLWKTLKSIPWLIEKLNFKTL